MYRKSQIATGLCLLCFLVVSAPSAFAQSVNLQWKWNAGDKLVVESEQDIEMTMTVGGQEMQTTNTTTSWMTWEVEKIDDNGNGVVNTVIDRIVMDMVTPMGNMNYDSSEGDTGGNPQLEMIAESLKPMIGAATTQTMSTRGEVVAFEMGEGVKESLDAMGGGQTGEMFEQISKNASLEFPEGSLTVGDSWDKSVTTNSQAGNVSVNTTYTYQGEVSVEGQKFHKFDVDVKMDFAQPMITIDEQSAKGELFFDAEAGRIDHSRVEQDVKMTISQGGQEIKQNLKQIATFSFKPVDK